MVRPRRVVPVSGPKPWAADFVSSLTAISSGSSSSSSGEEDDDDEGEVSSTSVPSCGGGGGGGGCGGAGEEGPVEETTAVAPDGSIIHVTYRGVDPALEVGSKEWRKEKRLADNRASAARSRALARLRMGDMGKQLEDVRAEAEALASENERLKALLAAHGIDVPVGAAGPRAAVAAAAAAAGAHRRPTAPAARSLARGGSTHSDASAATRRTSPPSAKNAAKVVAAAAAAAARAPASPAAETASARSDDSPAAMALDEVAELTPAMVPIPGLAGEVPEDWEAVLGDYTSDDSEADAAAVVAAGADIFARALPLPAAPAARDTSMASVAVPPSSSGFPPCPPPMTGTGGLQSSAFAILPATPRLAFPGAAVVRCLSAFAASLGAAPVAITPAAAAAPPAAGTKRRAGDAAGAVWGVEVSDDEDEDDEDATTAAKPRVKRARPLSPLNFAILGLAIAVAVLGAGTSDFGGGSSAAVGAGGAGGGLGAIRGRFLLEKPAPAVVVVAADWATGETLPVLPAAAPVDAFRWIAPATGCGEWNATAAAACNATVAASSHHDDVFVVPAVVNTAEAAVVEDAVPAAPIAGRMLRSAPAGRWLTPAGAIAWGRIAADLAWVLLPLVAVWCAHALPPRSAFAAHLPLAPLAPAAVAVAA